MINDGPEKNTFRKHFLPGKRIQRVSVLLFVLLMTSAVQPCTFFMATVEGVTFFGNNEDSSMPDTYIWFVPPEEGRYGCVFVSYRDGYPQGGMNDRGLSYDGGSTPKVTLAFSKEKISPRGLLTRKIMEECATIEEVIHMVETYKYPDLSRQGQLLFADTAGDAVIVGGPGETGDIDIIRKVKSAPSMVLTNFFPSHPELGGHPCRRYNAATALLKKDPSPTVTNFRSILKAVSTQRTQYSNIFDLNKKLIYLYHFHDFKNEIVLDLTEEFSKGPHAYHISSMFLDSGTETVIESLNDQRAKGRISRNIPEFRTYKSGK